jgi:hypothetical protein
MENFSTPAPNKQ